MRAIKPGPSQGIHQTEVLAPAVLYYHVGVSRLKKILAGDGHPLPRAVRVPDLSDLGPLDQCPVSVKGPGLQLRYAAREKGAGEQQAANHVELLHL